MIASCPRAVEALRDAGGRFHLRDRIADGDVDAGRAVQGREHDVVFSLSRTRCTPQRVARLRRAMAGLADAGPRSHRGLMVDAAVPRPRASASGCRARSGINTATCTCQAVLQLLHHGVGIVAGLLHVRGPFGMQRLGGLAPFGELLRRQRIDLVAGLRLDLVAAGRLEVRPRRRDLLRPFAACSDRRSPSSATRESASYLPLLITQPCSVT